MANTAPQNSTPGQNSERDRVRAGSGLSGGPFVPPDLTGSQTPTTQSGELEALMSLVRGGRQSNALPRPSQVGSSGPTLPTGFNRGNINTEFRRFMELFRMLQSLQQR